MNAARAPWRSSAGPAGRVALLAAVAFLLAVSTGNSLSLHVGMATMAPTAPTIAADVDDTSAPRAAMTSALPDVDGEASMDPALSIPMSPDAQHLMHLLGACLAVVAAALLLSLLLFIRVVGGSYTGVAAVPRLVTPTAVSAWSPPALSPPTSSPVIRT